YTKINQRHHKHTPYSSNIGFEKDTTWNRTRERPVYHGKGTWPGRYECPNYRSMARVCLYESGKPHSRISGRVRLYQFSSLSVSWPPQEADS
ncbi:MAG: hypothetical protein NXY57DRAFT_903555, partial [Lentinula lateritia]